MNLRIGIRFKILIGVLILLVPIVIYSLFSISEVNELKNSLVVNSSNIKDVSKKLEYIAQYTFIFSVSLIIVSFLLLFYLSNIVAKNIVYVSQIVKKLAEGETPKIENVNKVNDEIGDTLDNLKSMVTNLNDTALFAVKIGQGQLDANFTPQSENDALGHALLNMRNNLLEASIKDEERNKIIVCNAEISNILRSHTNLELMGDDLLKYICNKIKAIQGAFYVLDEVEGNTTIKLLNAYAYNKKKYIKRTFKIGESLVGQSAFEMDMIYRIEIPRDYVSITSGLLGEKRPQAILIMPLITNEKLYGLLEFASVNPLDKLEIQMVKEISEIIAQTIFNLQVNERTSKHLQESQRMGAELQEQSKALQKNAEDMEVAQEELQRTNQKLNIQIEEVNKSQKKTQVLLENSSEVIMVLNPEANCLYVSPSIPKILGHSVEDLTKSKSVYSFVHEEDVAKFENIVDTIIKNPKETLNAEFRIMKDTGEYIYTESTVKNMIHEPAISGIVLNIRDISARKEAEREARMRSQMQSLSENSPDLITRLNKDGKVFYINPTIEKLTAQSPKEFLQKNIKETTIDDTVKESWVSLINDVLANRDKMQVEMNFPTANNGSLVMNVNAIPEYGESETIESILLVSNDITDRKKAEVEIQAKNKKITESINYAKRIQVAILPDIDKIKQNFPDFFIFYKPRDVVSGDFPWYVESGDDIYIAAVDCTGHGVPGAMLSLIGYFLLNDIVKSQKILEPGTILDMLDKGVTQTLKQDMEGNEMKDGMDICLCRINKKKNIFQYAGAHRPLYVLRGSEVLEFKGDKFPIGGGVYKNQTNFTNHVVDLQKGDRFYFCSDGFPDQFGGPENRKIGPARIKQLILDSANEHNMDTQNVIFEDYFHEWMGNHKQMDDVLMIGLKIN